jgi:hypothetical protein
MIDDQSDYFDLNNHWLNASEQKTAAAQAKAEAEELERLNKRSGARVVTLDLQQRKVVNEKEKDVFERHRDIMRGTTPHHTTPHHTTA